MSDGTKIEWTNATWNVINGCSVVSPGCTNCYAMRLAGTRMRHHPSRHGLTVPSKAGPVWNGTVRFNEKVLLDPLKWRRPRKIFVCAHGDLFHTSVPDEWIDRVFAAMALASQHTFQILTKRPERMREYLRGHVAPRIWRAARALELSPKAYDAITHCQRPTLTPLPNVWLGVSVEDQARAEERIPVLLDTPAAVRWLSCEPLLGPVDLNNLCPINHPQQGDPNPFTGRCVWPSAKEYEDSINATAQYTGKISWVVAGGESGPAARPMQPEWARSLRDQCADAGVPFLFKQWGEFAPLVTTGHNDPRYPADPPTGERMERFGKKDAGRLLDGVLHDAYP